MFAWTAEITHAGVSVQRANTTRWLPVSADAIFPIGAGDSLRTDERGRVLLLSPEGGALVLLLPNSQLTLDESAGTVRMTQHYGESAHRVVGGTFGAYVLASGTQITRVDAARAAHLLVNHSRSLQTSYLLLADGAATLEAGTRTQPLDVDAGVLVGEGTRFSLYDALAAPYSPARLEGLYAGCAGEIVTADGQNLNARVGPSTRNLLLGQFPSGAQVQVMGFNEAGGWARVQFRGGFGWIERLAVRVADETCVLPILPDDAFDLPNYVFDVTLDELALLRPFYGSRTQDPIFYQRSTP